MTTADGRTNAYRSHVDFDDLDFRHPLPHRFIAEVMRWSPERMREHQEVLFADIVRRAWANRFYQEFWGRAGIEPGDIRGLDDVARLPVITHHDFRKSLVQCSPFGVHASQAFESRSTVPLKIQSSGGTTGAPRPTFFDPFETEVQGIQVARALLAQGIQAGDIMLLPTGTGHCELKATSEFLVVGAYPPGQHWDICRSAPSPAANERMRNLPFPNSDPVFGSGGPMTKIWESK